jgi:hypothetical protein
MFEPNFIPWCARTAMDFYLNLDKRSNSICGSKTSLTLSTIISLSTLNVAVPLILVEEAPTFTSYTPFSTTHADNSSSNDAMSFAYSSNFTFSFFPGFNSFVFVNAFNSTSGFSSFPSGADI